ncbi:hypothetical protein [Phormidesmis sp. 146-33]
MRNAGDYGQLNAISSDQATEQLNRADPLRVTRRDRFLKLAETLLGDLPP